MFGSNVPLAALFSEVGEFFVGNSGKDLNLGNDWEAILCDDIDIFARASKAKSRNAFCEKRVKGAMQCVTDSASTIGLWASSTWSRSTPALLHCGLPSCLPPLINIFGQVCPSDCHWSYRPRPRPVNWHWTDSGGETRRQLTSLTDFWHNFFSLPMPSTRVQHVWRKYNSAPVQKLENRIYLELTMWILFKVPSRQQGTVRV